MFDGSSKNPGKIEISKENYSNTIYSDQSLYFSEGQTVEFKAIPNSGFIFLGWLPTTGPLWGDVKVTSFSETYTYSGNRNLDLYAYFEEDTDQSFENTDSKLEIILLKYTFLNL